MSSDHVDVFFWLVMGLLAAGILLVVGQLVVRTVQNYRSSELRWSARVVAKRQHVSGSSNGPTSTTYYVTFEDQSGQRHEYSLSGDLFGKLAEGDAGTARTQGTWFLGFTRQR